MPPEPGMMSCMGPSWFSSARSQCRDDEPRPHATDKDGRKASPWRWLGCVHGGADAVITSHDGGDLPNRQVINPIRLGICQGSNFGDFLI
ncbi:hypothetical protein DAI22_01g362400 [Oryza sativa Japonica Group]|nr:hypothetical protein DAI22_01g362400 [Oryza sativa Japonica Group]